MKHKIDFKDSLEKIAVKIFPSSATGSLFVAEQIASLIREKEALGEICIIGLATGSSPKTLYAELVRMHKFEGLSFKNVITFNLDQYYPMEADALQSYHYLCAKIYLNKQILIPVIIFYPMAWCQRKK